MNTLDVPSCVVRLRQMHPLTLLLLYLAATAEPEKRAVPAEPEEPSEPAESFFSREFEIGQL